MVDIVTYGMAKAYADKAVNGAVTSVYTYKGRCTHAELANKTKTAGDVWAMSDSGDTWQVGQEYCYDPAANQWVAMSGLRTTVVNSLSSTSTHDALSAAQGKALNDTKADKAELAAKQDVLTAGENITIVNNVISATGGGGGGGGDAYTKAETDALLDEKQDVLTAGENITIVDNIISATGGGSSETVNYSTGEMKLNKPGGSFPRFALITDVKNILDIDANYDNIYMIDSTYTESAGIIFSQGGIQQEYDPDPNTDWGTSIPVVISDTLYVTVDLANDGNWQSTSAVYLDEKGQQCRVMAEVALRIFCSSGDYDESTGTQYLEMQYQDYTYYVKMPSWMLIPTPDGNYTRFNENYAISNLNGLHVGAQVPFIAYSSSPVLDQNAYYGPPALAVSGLPMRMGPLVMHAQGTPEHVTATSWGVPSPAPAPVTPPVSLPSIESITLEPPTPTYTDGDWGYDLDGDDAVIVCYTGSDSEVTVPSTVGGHTVTAIGKGAEGAVVTTSYLTFTLPSTLTAINAYAFANGYCTISNIPSGVTEIGDRAFYATTTNFTIPASVTSIGAEAFGGSHSTEGYTVDAANPAFMSRDGILFSKDGTKLIRYPPGNSDLNGEIYVVPDTVTEIAASAFQQTQSNIGFVILPDEGIKIIGDSAFDYCSGLVGTYDAVLKVPSTVQYIGAYAFTNQGNSPTEIILPESIVSIGEKAFYMVNVGSGSKCLVLPSTLQSIGEDAFDGTYMECVINYSSIDITQGNSGLEEMDPSKIYTQPMTTQGYFAPINAVVGNIAPYCTKMEMSSLVSSKAPKAALPSGKNTSDTVTFQDLINMGIVIAPPSS